MRRTTLLLLALVALPALAADEQKARDEIDKQLQQMVGKAPTRVKVEFVGVDEPNYVLEEAEFELDGVALKSPAANALDREQPVLVWQGDVKPGKHVLTARAVYANKASVVVSDEGGYKWKLAGTVSFDLFSGIEVQVKVTPARVAGQRDVSKRFKLSLPASPVMIAKLDDGKMPDPLKKAEPADAGVEVAAVDPKLKAKEEAEAKKLAAAEEKKAKAEAARQAKAEAAQKAKEAVAAKAEARRQAAEEKKRKAEEAKLAKAEAARKAKEEAELKKHPELAMKKEPPAELDAGAPVAVAEAPDAAVAEVDAGAAVAVAKAEAPDAGAATPAAPVEEGGLPWLPIGGAGAVVIIIVLIVIARRRASVPKID